MKHIEKFKIEYTDPKDIRKHIIVYEGKPIDLIIHSDRKAPVIEYIQLFETTRDPIWITIRIDRPFILQPLGDHCFTIENI